MLPQSSESAAGEETGHAQSHLECLEVDADPVSDIQVKNVEHSYLMETTCND